MKIQFYHIYTNELPYNGHYGSLGLSHGVSQVSDCCLMPTIS
jgi:hypothetical protein